MHLRTLSKRLSLPIGQARVAAKYCDDLVYFTENEYECFTTALTVNTDVPIYALHHTRIPSYGRLDVLSRSNFAYIRAEYSLARLPEHSHLDIKKALSVIADDTSLTG